METRRLPDLIPDLIRGPTGDSLRETALKLLYAYWGRTNRHVGLVRRAGEAMIPFAGWDASTEELFLTCLDRHDADKYKGMHGAVYAVATQHMHNPAMAMLFTPREGVLANFRDKAWPMHYKLNPHHAGEHFGHLASGTWVVPSDDHPLAVAEMVADWVAMGVELGNSANAWWEKCRKERKYSFQRNDMALIERLLAREDDALEAMGGLAKEEDEHENTVEP